MEQKVQLNPKIQLDVYTLNSLGEKFRSMREELGYRMEDLAEQGLSVGTISNFETGRKKVNQDKIIRLFNKIGVSTEEIPHLLSTHEQNQDEYLERLKLELTAVENEMLKMCVMGEPSELYHFINDLKSYPQYEVKLEAKGYKPPSYDEGVITVEMEYLPKVRNLVTLKTEDGQEIRINLMDGITVKLDETTTYVSGKVFDLFG